MTTIPTRMVRRHGIALLVSSALLFLMAYATHANADPGRASLERQILGLLREGNTEEALPLCRDYAEKYPGDALMLYNLACLENGAGNEERAADAFGRAIAAGFEDFDHALKDPDLAGVDAVPGLIETETARLAALTVARAPVLAYGAWSPDLPLTDRTSLSGAELSGLSDPVLRLGWQPTGLDIEVNAAEDWAGMGSGEALSPANGGSGLFLSLSIPDGRSPFTSANHFLFAFGVEKGAGIGAMFIPEQQRWQRIQELDPKIRMDDAGRYNLVAFLPWQAVMPFHPLVDAPLGINAGLFMGGAAGPVMASLLQAQDLRDPTAVTRRFVPVEFDAASVPGDVFLGRVSNSISTDDPLAVELAVLAGSPGPGTLTFDFLDGFGRSVLPTGAFSERIDLAAGPNRLTRQADFQALETGSYLLRTEMAFPSGHTAQWSTSILHLATDWDGRLAARIEILPEGEAATAEFYLDTVRDAVARHPVRRSPKAIGRTLTDLVTLLDNAEAEGTILPDKGVFLMIYPGPDGDRRLASLYLPPARHLARRINPVLVLNPSPGAEGRISGRIGRNYEYGDLKPTIKGDDAVGFPVYIVPRLESLEPGVAPDPVAEAAACLEWALAYFETEAVSVVGVDGTGAAALGLVERDRTQVGPMLIFAGRNLEPWPQANNEFIRSRLGTMAGGPPLTWLDFEAETSQGGQGPIILEELRGLGADIVEVQEVRGGLSLTQAADRTVLWAEGLR